MLSTLELTTAVEYALRAPSVHNTQPWSWRIRRDGVDLYADWSRQLTTTDPHARDLLISCGAALHHMRVALAHLGAGVRVNRLPEPDRPELLAVIDLLDGATGPDRSDAELFPAISRRRTDRGALSHRLVPPEHLGQLAALARGAGAELEPVPEELFRERLGAALADAALDQQNSPRFQGELHRWTGRPGRSRDGIPATVPCAGEQLASPTHPLRPAPATYAPELTVLTTRRDEVADRLRAGEATSAVLLGATMMGLATTPMSQLTEQPIRQIELCRQLHGHPQLVVRVGWPVDGPHESPPPERTPRRDLQSVLNAGFVEASRSYR
jgi:nitroreductase